MMTAQEHKDFRRVQTSRDSWKKRAVRRGEDRRRIRQRHQEVGLGVAAAVMLQVPLWVCFWALA
jgi:hypothetical protein